MAKSRVKKRRRVVGATALDGAPDTQTKESESHVLRSLAGFTDEVVVIVEKMLDVVERFAADDYDKMAEAAQEIDRLESAADDSKEALLDLLARGSLFPMSRADLARMVGSMDGIANLATGAVDRISMRRFTLPARLNEHLVELAQVDLKAVRVLREAVAAMGADLGQAIKLAGEVDRIESHADDIFAELYRGMFDFDTDYKTFHQFKAIIERLENVADRCCENAELIRHMALEYLENE